MKKRLLLIALIIATTKTLAQQVTVDDMIKYSACKDFILFHDYMYSNGFGYDSPSEDGNYTKYRFTSNDPEENGIEGLQMKSTVLFFMPRNGKTKNFCFMTSAEAYYLNLVSGFKNRGFVITDRYNEGDKTITEYKSKNYPDLLLKLSATRTHYGGIAYPLYVFNLYRNF